MVTFRQVIVTKFMISMFLRKFHEISRYFFFTGTFMLFTGGNFHFFHAHYFLFSRETFGEKFHGDFLVFTGSFQDIFTGRFTFSRAEIQKFSREEKKISRGKKKHCGGPMRATRARACSRRKSRVGKAEGH